MDELPDALITLARSNPEVREAVDKLILAGFRKGLKFGIGLYAVWKDGEQLVGIMHHPLSKVLAEVDAGKHDAIVKATLLHEYRG